MSRSRILILIERELCSLTRCVVCTVMSNMRIPGAQWTSIDYSQCQQPGPALHMQMRAPQEEEKKKTEYSIIQIFFINFIPKKIEN